MRTAIFLGFLLISFSVGDVARALTDATTQVPDAFYKFVTTILFVMMVMDIIDFVSNTKNKAG